MLLLVSLLTSSVLAAPPLPITNPGELIIATIEGGMPSTVDPAWVYDTASAEVMQNVLDTLVTFDGEHMDRYLPALATNWSITDITGTKTHMGIDLYYRYTFTIRTGVTFHNGNPLTTSDVEYSIERGMAQDRTYGPQWMFYEPLLYSWGSHAWDTDTETINNNTALASYVGNIIDDAVESDSKNVWFNIAFPGVYAPFMQILCQQWASVLDQEWCVSNGRTDWSGDWGAGGGNHTEWVNYNDPELSPLDDPSPIMMGCGPFEYDTLDYTAKYWSVVRFEDYWRGWPADFPDVSTPNVQGYILRMTVTWAYVWEVRSTMFQQGDVDLCAVPRAHMGEVNNKDGIRLIWPLPQLACDGMFYTFKIDPATPYGPILAKGTFAETGIPTDFFGNATWGIHVR
jgi:peptide/nickel transport system substrate-binding protein